MKLKNNDPGKILSKSDDWFKSYGQKIFSLIVSPGTRTGNRVIGFLEPENRVIGPVPKRFQKKFFGGKNSFFGHNF